MLKKNFESIDGVVDVVSGYSGGNYENPSYQDVLNNRRTEQGETFLSILKNIGMSDEEKEGKNTLINHTETVKVVYDSSMVSTETLIKNFWEIHDPTQSNRQGNDVGNNYRSAIYWTTDKQKDIATRTGQEFQKLLSAKGYGQIVTEMAALEKFWPAENYHQGLLVKESKWLLSRSFNWCNFSYSSCIFKYIRYHNSSWGKRNYCYWSRG